jgi:hypothetical protein
MDHTVAYGTPSCVDMLVVFISGFAEMTTRILPSPEVITLFMVAHTHITWLHTNSVISVSHLLKTGNVV